MPEGCQSTNECTSIHDMQDDAGLPEGNGNHCYDRNFDEEEMFMNEGKL